MYINMMLRMPVWLASLCFFYQAGFSQQAPVQSTDTYLIHTTNPHTTSLRLYWKNEKGTLFGTFRNLSHWLTTRHEKLVFAMNGGMFTSQYDPVGVYIENGKTQHPLDTNAHGYGNFYMQPNGVFYLTSTREAGVCTTQEFSSKKNIAFATQSGPMLLVNGQIHPTFTKGSSNVNIRNGVGILPDGKVLFVLSKKEVNFHDFASFFKQAGCTNALYLDGVVSRAYYPAQHWIQTDGTFGVLIAESVPLGRVPAPHN